MHVAIICNEMTWYVIWEHNDHEKGNLFCKRLRSKTDQVLKTANHSFFLSKLDLGVNQYFVHILSLITDNNPS